MELKAIPIPIPKISTPAIIAMVLKLNMGDLKLGDLVVFVVLVAVAVLPVDLRLIKPYGSVEIPIKDRG